jgi:hypothetical protein
MDTPVAYYQAGLQVEEFMEDFSEREFTEYALLGLVEYVMQDSDRSTLMTAGVSDESEIKVTFGLDDLTALGLIDEHYMPIMSVEADYMIVNGERYRITLAVPDGPFEQKNVLIIVYGTKKDQSA